MPRIVMDGTHRGSNSGHDVRRYRKGEVYDSRAEGDCFISEELAKEFIRKGWAHEQTIEEWSANLNPCGHAVAVNQSLSGGSDV